MAIFFTKYFVCDKIIFCGLKKCKKLIYNGTNPHGSKKSPYMPFSSGQFSQKTKNLVNNLLVNRIGRKSLNILNFFNRPKFNRIFILPNFVTTPLNKSWIKFIYIYIGVPNMQLRVVNLFLNVFSLSSQWFFGDVLTVFPIDFICSPNLFPATSDL